MENFLEPARLLQGCGSLVQVIDAASLAAAAGAWLSDPEAAAAAGAAGAKCFDGLEELPAKLAALILDAAL
jgi:hypothetical protein